MLGKKVNLPLMSTNTFQTFKEILNYNSLQQINCLKNKSFEKETTDEQKQFYKKDHYSITSTESQNKYLQFHQPYRRFVQKHKIIEKVNMSRPRLTKQGERVELQMHIKRTISISHKLIYEPYSKKSKQQNLLIVFDWMMELASLLKITKNSYFRSIIIFQRIYEINHKIVFSKKLINYACAALSLGTKFQCSKLNYLSKIFIANQRKIAKSQLSSAQNYILSALKWKIPINIFLEQDLTEIIRLWNDFLGKLERLIDRNLRFKLYIKCQDKVSSKLYIEIVYILDFLVTQKHQEFLKEEEFKRPILIAMYMLLSINGGDLNLTQNFVWALFQKFIVQNNLLQKDQLETLKDDAIRNFNQMKIIEVLGKIPLNLNFQKILQKKYEQFYIRKIQPFL